MIYICLITITHETITSIFPYFTSRIYSHHLFCFLGLSDYPFPISSFRVCLIRCSHHRFSFLSSSRNLDTRGKETGITFFSFAELLYFSLTLINIHMIQFTNIINSITRNTKLDFRHLVQIRRCKLEREGHFTHNINWEHYAKVLEAKQRLLPD